MGAKASKALKRKTRRAIATLPEFTAPCAKCQCIFEPKNYCDTCALGDMGTAWSKNFYCDDCKEGHLMKCEDHVFLPFPDPISGRDIKQLRKNISTIEELDADVSEAFGELREQMNRAEKAQRHALESCRAVIEKYEWSLRESRPKGVLGDTTKLRIEHRLETAKFRSRLLVARVKALEDTFESVMSANSIDLAYCCGEPRDAILSEIRRQYRASNLNAASEGLFELLEASGGRVTLSEMYLVAEVIMEKVETLRRFYDKMMDDRAVIETQESGRLVSTMMENVVEDLRHESSAMFNLLNMIRGHAAHYDDSEIPRERPMTTIQYLLSLHPHKDAAPKLNDKVQKSVESLQEETFRFRNVQIKSVRHFVACSVAALWLHLTPADAHDYGEVADQLRCSWKGYLATATEAGWGDAHPVRVLLCALLLELALNSEHVAAFKSLKKAARKIADKARKGDMKELSRFEKHMSEECMDVVIRAFQDLESEDAVAATETQITVDEETMVIEDDEEFTEKFRFDITGKQEQRELGCSIRCHYDFLSGVLVQSQKKMD